MTEERLALLERQVAEARAEAERTKREAEEEREKDRADIEEALTSARNALGLIPSGIARAKERHPHDLGKHTGGVIGARAYNDANFNHDSTGNWKKLTFNSERWDTDSIHSTSSNTGRLTAKTAGKYIIWGGIQWAADANGRRHVDIYLNNTTTIARQTELNPTATAARQTITTIYDLAADDYVELRGWQNSGGNLSIEAQSNWSPEFSMARVGAAGSAGAGTGGTDHGNLAGLGDDDHTLYLLAAGTRAGSTGSAQDFGSTGIKVNVIAESTGATGVTADGVLLKDSAVTTDVIHEKTSAAGVIIDGLLIKDNFIEHEEIPTPTNPALNNLRLFARASGANIQLIALSSQGAECVICTLDDTAVAHTNILTLDWIE